MVGVVELTWWQAYLINLGYILLCMIVNLLGVSTMGHFSKVRGTHVPDVAITFAAALD